jgi:Spx/MgsR family transcriptional regulator
MIILYGIPNCDTVKKARAWLTAQGLAHEFHDFKKAGVPADRLAAWEAELGWEKLLNRKGTTWRKLDPQQQAGVVDAVSAQALMQAQPSLSSGRWWNGEPAQQSVLTRLFGWLNTDQQRLYRLFTRRLCT